jgi:hypothetical protein
MNTEAYKDGMVDELTAEVTRLADAGARKAFGMSLIEIEAITGALDLTEGMSLALVGCETERETKFIEACCSAFGVPEEDTVSVQ